MDNNVGRVVGLKYGKCEMLMISIDFFVFKQKTAYEMRISDWSSDVCSSDLVDRGQLARREPFGRLGQRKLRKGLRKRRRGTDHGSDIGGRAVGARRRCELDSRRGRRERRDFRETGHKSASPFFPFVLSLSKHRPSSCAAERKNRSEEHPSDLQSLMR